jgi:hypothetical protein
LATCLFSARYFEQEHIMADYESHSTAPGGTTIIEKKGSGGTVLIALVLLVAVLIGGWYLFTTQGAQTNKDNAVAGAAKSVSSAADKVGDAATGDTTK